MHRSAHRVYGGSSCRFKPGKMHMYPASEVVLNLGPIIFNSIQWTSRVSLYIRPVHLVFSLQQDKSNQLLLEAMDLGRALWLYIGMVDIRNIKLVAIYHTTMLRGFTKMDRDVEWCGAYLLSCVMLSCGRLPSPSCYNIICTSATLLSS